MANNDNDIEVKSAVGAGELGPVSKTRRPELQERATAGAGFATLGLGSLWTYLCFVFIYGREIGSNTAGAFATIFIIAIGLIALFVIAAQLLKRRKTLIGVALSLGMATFLITVTLLGADLVFGVFANVSANQESKVMPNEKRRDDLHIWHGELYPEYYFPTEKNFALFKPNVTLTAETYGEFYHPDLLASALVAEQVLEYKSLTYRIGQLGLRDTADLAKTRIFALGDSFAMGYGTDEGLTWTDRLGDALGEPVYNMGVSGTGPSTQLMLLEHVLDDKEEPVIVRQLLWMLFEGNDLENSYQKLRPVQPASGERSLFADTLLENLLSIPGVVQSSSILGQAVLGRLRRPTGIGGGPDGFYEVEGILSHFPLHHSERWGYRLFNPQDIERSTKPASYVLEHENWPRLAETLAAMKKLSETHNFEVTVIIAPTAARLYCDEFDGCPKLSVKPHFINALTTLAQDVGFEVIDMLPLLRPHAQQHMLYYRDDHHWNVRGNQVAADVIQGAIGSEFSQR